MKLIDLALAIERLVPAAGYGGTTNGDTREVYDALVWTDSRAKPTWAAIVAADLVVPADVIAEQRAATFLAQPDRADLLNRLRTATPAQIDSWLAANVTTLAQARTVLAAVIKVLALNAWR